MLDTDGATVAASGSSVMIIRHANPFRATYFYHLLPINIRIFILRNNPKEGRSPQLRAAVRPRSATFIHFYVDPPLTRARRNRAGAPSARACSSVHRSSRVRCRLCMCVCTRFDLARWRHLIRIRLSARISSLPSLRSSVMRVGH